VTTSQTPFLFELMAGHSGPPIPVGKRAYFQERLRIRVFNFLLSKFVQAQAKGLNKNVLAKRIGRSPEVINRWLGAPSNLTLDTISDLLLGISAEELEPDVSSPIGRVQNNYSHFDELAAKAQPASAMANADLSNSTRLARTGAQENAYSTQSEGATLG
jgi:hypothetical protein